MRRIIPSAPDPYVMARRSSVPFDPNVGEQIDLETYTGAYGPLVPGQVTGVVLAYGQSNIANFCDSSYIPTQANGHQLNAFNGGVYLNKIGPMLGCNGGLLNGPYGTIYNPCTEMIDKLLAAGWAQRVVVCNVAAGGTSSAQWADPLNADGCNPRLKVAARRIRYLGLHNAQKKIVLRHQGETDATSAFTAAQVRDNIRAEVATLRAEGIDWDVLVCRVSISPSVPAGDSRSVAVRQGQVDAGNTGLKIFLGPDTDTLGASNRHDGLHWSNTGRGNVSTLFANAIIAQVP